MGGKRNCEMIDKGLYKRYSKGGNRYSLLYKFAVAPCAGAGIEIVPFKLTNATSYVVPRAGAGIEIFIRVAPDIARWSHPRGCVN